MTQWHNRRGSDRKPFGCDEARMQIFEERSFEDFSEPAFFGIALSNILQKTRNQKVHTVTKADIGIISV